MPYHGQDATHLLAALFAVPLLYAADPLPASGRSTAEGRKSIRHSTLKQINRANVKQLDRGVVLRCAGWAGRIADQPHHRRRRPVRQHAEEPRDRAGRGHREAALEIRFRARPARSESRRHLLGGRRRPAHLRRGRRLRLRARRAHRQAHRELRQRRPHRSARRPGARSGAAIGRADHARRHLQGPADCRRTHVGGPARLARRHPRLRRAHRQAALDASTPFRIRASSVTTPGRRTPGPTPARRTTGRAWRWTRSAASSSCRPGRAAADFYGANRLGDNLFANYAARARCRDRQADLALSGGQARPLGSRLSLAADPGDRAARTARRSTPWRRPPSTATSSCSTARPASRCSRSSSASIRPARCRAKSPPRRSRCPPSPRRSRARC